MVGERGLLEVLRARHSYQELTTQIEQLKAQNNALRDTARRLREDPATIESVARQELGLIRPGEKVFIIRNVAVAPGAPELPPAR
jgi:cell division protein FtsB